MVRKLADEERWLPVVGYEGVYVVSSLGRVRLLEHSFVRRNGSFFSVRSKIKKPYKDRHGYLQVRLQKNQKGKNKSVHRLVAEAFIPNPDNKPEVNHKNGVRTDNRIENLEWVSRNENIQHSYDFLGHKRLHRFGRDNPNCKIVLKIKDGVIIQEFFGAKAAAESVGACVSSIQRACTDKIKTCKGFVWKHKNKKD